LNCANTYQQKGLTEKAIKLYNQALGSHRNLANTNPKKYLPTLAHTLNNLAVLYYESNKSDIAKKLFLEALKIRRKIAFINPQKFLSVVGETLHNLGLLFAKIKTEKAKNYYLEAVRINKKLAEFNPQKHSQDIAMNLNGLGGLFEHINEYEKSQQFYKEALKIYRESAGFNSEKYLPKVGMTLNSLGNLQKLKNDIKNAEKNYKESLKIHKKLANTNPIIFIPKLCLSKVHMSIFYQDCKVNKKLSIELATDAVKELLPFVQTGKNRSFLQVGCKVLLDWGIDIERLISETHYNYANTDISCPECSWVPDGKNNWQCTCGLVWDTFMTKGKCIRCEKQWIETWCPKCKLTSEHLKWY
jgi:tetratricopeptide (TPR) repeat protein